LNHIGYKEVEFAPHGEKAIELYRAALGSDHPFDAVILDFTIPGGMGAAETMLRLRGIDPDVKAIITSGYAEEQVISNFKQYGFKAALAKPFTLDELKQALSRCLGAD
jgi:CheY-like chemotaxis protein